MSQTPTDSRTDSKSGEQTSADAYPTADPGIELYEDSEQVGVIDLGAETYEYNGSYEQIDALLQETAEDGWYIWTGRNVKATGIGLGKKLLRRLHLRAASDLSSEADLDLAAIGFEPEHEGILDGSSIEEGCNAIRSITQRRAERDGDAEGEDSEAQER